MGVQGQPDVHSETWSPKNKKTNYKTAKRNTTETLGHSLRQTIFRNINILILCVQTTVLITVEP
jgi:hypothetical protein